MYYIIRTYIINTCAIVCLVIDYLEFAIIFRSNLIMENEVTTTSVSIESRCKK